MFSCGKSLGYLVLLLLFVVFWILRLQLFIWVMWSQMIGCLIMTIYYDLMFVSFIKAHDWL